MFKKKKVVIFDFDGVVVDSFDHLYEINRLAALEVGKVLMEEDFRNFFVGNIHKEIGNFIGSDSQQNNLFTAYKYKIFPDFYNEQTVRLFDFSEEMIVSIAVLGELVIISSAPENLILNVLKSKNLDRYFANISGINRNGKRETVIKRLNNDQDTYFITDTVGDIVEVAGLDVVSFGVTWGFHGEKELLEVNPTYVVNDYKELIKLISE